MCCTPPGLESPSVMHCHNTAKTKLSQWCNTCPALNTRTRLHECDMCHYLFISDYVIWLKEIENWISHISSFITQFFWSHFCWVTNTPVFGLLVRCPLGFKAKVGSLYLYFVNMYVLHIHIFHFAYISHISCFITWSLPKREWHNISVFVLSVR